MSESVWAIVLTWNRAQRLTRCLEAISRQTRQPDAILVVNNGSTDNTDVVVREAASRLSVPVTLMTLPRNGGCSEGYWAAIPEALSLGADWVWLAEDDTIPDSRCLERLLSLGPTVAAAVPAVHTDRGEILTVPRGTLRSTLTGTPCVPIGVDRYDKDEPIALEYFGYLGALVSRQAIEQAGLPPREYFMWVDDVAWSSEVARAGRVCLVPRAVVVHEDDSLEIAAYQEGFITRVSHYRSPIPFDRYWRNMYGLRNLLHWGRRRGYVRWYHAMVYAGFIAARSLLFDRTHRLRRARLTAIFAMDGWRGRFRTVAPPEWPELVSGPPLASLLDRLALTYDDLNPKVERLN